MTRKPIKRRPYRPDPEQSRYSRPGGPRRRPLNAYLVIAFVLMAAYWGWANWQTGRFEEQFASLVAAGQPGLAAVETHPVEGRGEGREGESYRYLSDPPTSGRHPAEFVGPGFYEIPQDDARLVHGLEHGSVVVYYDDPDAPVLTDLRRWAAFYRNAEWAGLIVAPRAGLEKAVVLTAWGKRLVLESYDSRAAAAFIDRYRGRGPERTVR